jgi:hypothetical protein
LLLVKYDVLHVDSIKNIMEHQCHTEIYLLKFDIECAEIETLNKILYYKTYPTTYVLLEK